MIFVVQPIKMDHMEKEEIIFDANRDNNGKGIPLNEMIKALKKSLTRKRENQTYKNVK